MTLTPGGSPECRITTAVILAGGLGTRLRKEVPDLPKAMAPVAGKPFLARQMDYWMGEGIRRFVLSVGYRRQAIISHFGQKYAGADIAYAIEEEPLGTGGGFLLAMAGLGEEDSVLVANGDTFFQVGLRALSKFHSDACADWTLALFSTEDSERYMGIDVDATGRVAALKSPHRRPPLLANGGVYLVRPRVLEMSAAKPGAKLSLEDELLPELIAAGARVYGLPVKGRFIDIGVPADYHRAAAVIAD